MDASVGNISLAMAPEEGKSIHHTPHLYRMDFQARTSTGLRFPAADRGFKGSAWHGRIDHVIRRNAELRALLPESNRPGAPARYWIEAPEDRDRDNQGPFGLMEYSPGYSFRLSIFVGGVELTPAMAHQIAEAIQQAGCIAGKSKGNKEQLQLVGRFEVTPMAVAPLQLRDLRPAMPAGATALLALHFLTMLRLDDGQGLALARKRFADGQMCVPRLSLLAARVAERCTNLGLFKNAPWMETMLADAVLELRDREEAIRVQPASVFPWDLQRVSAHAGRRDPIGGLIGHAAYQGPTDLLARVFPIFKLAEWTRLGRKTGLGNGRIRVELQSLSM